MTDNGPSRSDVDAFDDVDEVEEFLTGTRHRSRSRWRWVIATVAVIVIFGWAFVAGRSLGRDPTLVRSPLIGKPAPAFQLPTLDGGEIDSAAFRGQVIVVNFWASWCVPCKEEAPELQAFAARWAGRGVNLVGIVYNDDESKAGEFRDRYELTYPQTLDPGGRTAIDYGVFGVPETYVIARDGTVMAKLLGAVDAATLERVVSAVEDGRTVSTGNDRYRTGPGEP
jgi:cytochrome c biogenesis protein CcmG/thiol:disulfide interchange protein DsbE